MPYHSCIYWQVIHLSLLFCKHWLRQHLLLNCLYWISDSHWFIWSTNQDCTYQFPCCIVSSRCFYFLWLYLIIGCLARTIWLAVICERGNLSLSYYPLPFQNPRSPRMSPLGLASLKRKNLPIMVTLGGIGSCYASLALYLIAFILVTNCTITGSFLGEDWTYHWNP